MPRARGAVVRGFHAGSRPRTGLTLLEVVLAVVLLGIVAVAATGLITAASRLQADNYQRLGAYELASRLIIQFLDDEDQLPDRNLPIEYGPYRYRWDLREDTARMRVKMTESAARSAEHVSLSRFRRITVRVWLVPPGTDPSRAPAGDELAVLHRVYDPMAMSSRNADSFNRIVKSEDGLRKFLQHLMQHGGDGQGGGSAQPQNQPGPGAPAPANPRQSSPGRGR